MGSPSGDSIGDRRLQFRWFATLWAIAFSVHALDTYPPNAWPVLVAAIPCLVAPGSVVALAVLFVVGTVVAANELPEPANHLILALLVNLAFVASAAAVLWRRRRSTPEEGGEGLATRWIAVARTPVGLTLVAVYFFAVFHKLNTSFFDPEVSCAGVLLRMISTLQGLDFGWITEDVVVGNAFLTVTLEAVIVVCLAVPRLRRWGLLFGTILHFGLAWAKFYDFSSFAFALYVLLLPPETWSRVRRPERWRRVAIAGIAVHVAVAYLGFYVDPPLGVEWHSILVGTWSIALGALVLPLLLASFAPGGAVLRAPRWSLRPAWLLVFPALAALNGAMPYLGLKTTPSYSMFSNLRTEEGRTNHLIGAAGALEIADYQRDTVDVLEIEVPRYPALDFVERARGGNEWFRGQTSAVYNWSGIPRAARRSAAEGDLLRLTWVELRRSVSFWKDAGVHGIGIRYLHDGVERSVSDAITDPVLSEPISWWERNLMSFRPIHAGDGPVPCRW